MHGAPSKPTVQLPLAHQAIHDWQVVKQDSVLVNKVLYRNIAS